MVSYNFPHQMARPLIFGLKCSALKPNGKRPHVAVEGTVTAFVGNVAPDWGRSNDCHRLIDAPCTRSDAVVMEARGIIRDGNLVTNAEWYRTLAEDEGFPDFSALQEHYDRIYGFPWEGRYVRWNPREATFRAQWPLVVKPPKGDGPTTE